MATDLKSTHEPSVTTLVTGIISDAEELFKQQFELLKTEVREDLRKSKEAGFVLGLGAWFGLIGAILLVLALVYLTQWLLPALPLWICYLIWGAVTFIIGAILFFAGKQKLDSFTPLPEKSAQALKENVQWLTTKKI
jgi:Putative Actinobacterial Holin-X, holin superfamily III